MKRLITSIALLIMIGCVFYYRNEIVHYIMVNYIYKKEAIEIDNNLYQKQMEVAFVKETNQFTAESKQDILNIFYTVLNSGMTDFTFFCDENYETCMDDVKDVTDDKTLLSNINNFVSPFNSYDKILVNINNFGKIDIHVSKLYQENEIQKINEKIDEIIKEYIKGDMDNKTKILYVHDYIINTTKYDGERADAILQNQVNQNLTYLSHKATGPLLQGMGICGGYSDAMALFLDRFDIPNYKVSSDTHVWNLVNLDGTWYHLDLTWDDPVTDTNEDLLMYNFFLITSEALREKETKQHEFPLDIFIEAR